ncbi:hypothetical protein GGP42_001591 [Salinibacter ruber]|nr:hypothetical protein [Salinibacter ruber]
MRASQALRCCSDSNAMKRGQGLLFFSGSWENSQAGTIAQVALPSSSERPRSKLQTINFKLQQTY